MSHDDDLDHIDDTEDEPATLCELRLDVELEESLVPNTDPDLMDLRSVLGRMELADGDAARAVSQFELLADACAVVEGPLASRTLRTRGWLGIALIEAHRFDQAEQVLAELLIDRTEVLGADDRETLSTRGNLARAVGRGGRPEEALVISELLLQDRVRLFGPDDRDTLNTRGHIAQFHDMAGDTRLSAQLQEELFFDRARVLGSDDHDTVTSLQNTTLTLSRLRPLDDETLDRLRQMIVRTNDELGPDHPTSLIARSFLASALASQGHHLEALEQFEAILDARIRTLGDHHPSVVVTRHKIALVHRQLGHLTRAIEGLDEVMTLLRDTVGASAVEALEARVDLVKALVETRDLRRARTELDALRRDAQLALEPSHPIMHRVKRTWRKFRWARAMEPHRHPAPAGSQGSS